MDDPTQYLNHQDQLHDATNGGYDARQFSDGGDVKEGEDDVTQLDEDDLATQAAQEQLPDAPPFPGEPLDKYMFSSYASHVALPPLNHLKKVSKVIGVELMVAYLGVPQTVAVKICKNEYGTYISYKILKMLYENHLSVATRLKDAHMMDEIHERYRHMDTCVKCFLLYLVGCLLYGDKSNKHIELVYLRTMEDYATMGDYSRGGMTMAYLYHCLSEVALPNGKALGGSTTLLIVINCHF